MIRRDSVAAEAVFRVVQRLYRLMDPTYGTPDDRFQSLYIWMCPASNGRRAIQLGTQAIRSLSRASSEE